LLPQYEPPQRGCQGTAYASLTSAAPGPRPCSLTSIRGSTTGSLGSYCLR
jgi:hypothetical protein